MALPLDTDGFLRRECPTCERELKWRVADDGEEAIRAPDGGYFCPYCGVQGPVDAWWTQAQLEAANAQAYREVRKPELEKLAQSARAASGGLVSIGVEINEPDVPPPLSESDDMRRIDFPRHPEEPVKVLDDWVGPVHRALCGAAVQPPVS